MINLLTPLFVFFAVIGYGFWIVMRRRQEEDEERSLWGRRLMDVIGDVSSSEESGALLKTEKNVGAFESLFTSKMTRSENLHFYLLRAGILMSSYQFILACLAATLGGGALSYLLMDNFFFSLVFGVFAGTVLPGILIMFLMKKREKAFILRFPDALDMIRRGLRSGNTVDKAIEIVGDEIQGIVGDAFVSIVRKVKLGQPLEKALAEMANQVGVDEFRMLAIVIVLQRETGGSLSETIDSLAKLMRERQRIQRKLKMLTAEGRVSGIIVTAIPFALGALITLVNPTFMDPLFYTETGNKLLFSGCIFMALGIVMIYRIVNKDPYS